MIRKGYHLPITFPLFSLAGAGQEKYGNRLNFEVGCTFSKGHTSSLAARCATGIHQQVPSLVQGLWSTKMEASTFKCYYVPKNLEQWRRLSVCALMANEKGEYKFCPGVDLFEYETKYFSKIRYDVKNLRRANSPFERIDSCNCLLFHKLAKNASIIEKELECVLCSACKRLVSDLNQRLKTAVSSPVKVKRQQTSSNCPLKYMSPSSQKKRKENAQREQAKDRSRLQKYLHTELTLDDDQHDELSKLMDTIEEKGGKEIEEVMQDAESHGVGDSVCEIWQMDMQRVKDIFNNDQQRNSEQ